MRLIGQIEGERRAHQFGAFLDREQIVAQVERNREASNLFEVWIADEEQLDLGRHWLGVFHQEPNNACFNCKPHPVDRRPVTHAGKQDRSKGFTLHLAPLRGRAASSLSPTVCIIVLCSLLFIIGLSTGGGSSSPLFQAFAFDLPASAGGLSWIGLYTILLHWPESRLLLRAPLFERVAQGELWRLFTPALLHAGILHLLFNMLWLNSLGKQIERRLRYSRYLLLTLLLGVGSNTAQYLVSGPYFMGYSGIVCGLLGFIWMRKQVAPWEIYPLTNSTVKFLAFFVLALSVLQLVIFWLARLGVAQLPSFIANTAHITGGLLGIGLARINYFGARK